MSVIGLHGFSGSRYDWKPVSEALGRPILGIDLVGHGECPAPAETNGFNTDAMLQCVSDGLGESGPVTLVGYSMGARVALRFAIRFPERVSAMVLIGVNPGLVDPVQRSERMARDFALAGRIEANGVDWFCDHWAQQSLIRSQKSIPAHIREPMERRKRQNRSEGLAGSLRGFGQGAVDPVWDRLGSVCVPSLLISGVTDEHYTDIAVRMVAAMPEATHRTIPNAGHCAHLENLSESTREIGAFLDRIIE